MAESQLTKQNDSIWKSWRVISAVVVAIIALVALIVIKPAMPDRIALLTGPEGTAYYELGQRYAADLRRRGLDAKVVATAGPLENIQRVAQGETAVAFAPSTMDWNAAGDASQLAALGSVGYEPLWLFCRSGLELSRVGDLAGKTVLAEGPGTTSHHVAEVLFEKNDIAGQVKLEDATGDETPQVIIDKFTSGAIDALFITGGADSTRVKTMLAADVARLFSFDRAEAYAAVIPGIATVVAPEGVFDLARNVPEQDTKLLAGTTCLVADEHLHPAVVPMVLIAAENTRPQRSPFTNAESFPNSEHLTLPLDWAARRYFSQGEVGLAKFLPYQVTRYLHHLGFLVLPLVVAAFLLLKIVPVCLKAWTNFRLKRAFKRLAVVEKGHAAGKDTAKLLAELDRIDQQTAPMFVPTSSIEQYIDFRQFLHDMRERIAK